MAEPIDPLRLATRKAGHRFGVAPKAIESIGSRCTLSDPMIVGSHPASGMYGPRGDQEIQRDFVDSCYFATLQGKTPIPVFTRDCSLRLKSSANRTSSTLVTSFASLRVRLSCSIFLNRRGVIRLLPMKSLEVCEHAL